MDIEKYSCDGKFTGNKLVLGQTRCGQKSFVQNLGKNKMFGKIKDVSWVKKIVLSKEREGLILCFEN